MASVCVLVPDSGGVRNFVYGGLLKELEKAGDLHVFHPFPHGLLESHAEVPGKRNQLNPYGERAAEHLIRVSLDYASLFGTETFSKRVRLNQPTYGSRRRRMGHRVGRFVGSVVAKSRVTKLLQSTYYAVASRNHAYDIYRTWLTSHEPDVVFCTHQRPQGLPNVLPMILAARKLGIPTVTFIYSWDNLTTKSRLAAPFDYYLVWSQQMKSELVFHYPDVDPEKVKIVGTPQFDPHVNESLLLTRAEFFKEIGADEKRPLICYSSGAQSICPEDPLHVAILIDLIRSGTVRGNPQVLVRMAPVGDDRARYSKVIEEYPELMFEAPRWERFGDHWSEVLPTPADSRFLANLINHADININVASTMTLDFAIRDKPVVNIAFDVADEPPFGLPLWEYYYRFDHYRPVVEIGAARFARSAEELAEHLNAYLEDPSLDKEKRRRLVELEVGAPIGESISRVVRVLDSIAQRVPRGHRHRRLSS